MARHYWLERGKLTLDNGTWSAQYVDMRHVVLDNEPLETTPLTEPVFLVLLSLVQAPRHGYALLKDTEALTGC